MRRLPLPAIWAAFLGLATIGPADAQHSNSGGAASVTPPRPGIGSPSCPPPPVVRCPPRVIRYAPTVSFFPGPFGFVPYAPPLVVASGPGAPFVAVPPFLPAPAAGPWQGVLPPGMEAPGLPDPPGLLPMGAVPGQGGAIEQDASRRPAAPRRVGAPTLSARGEELQTFGDRNFRANDLPRAERRYRQALAEAPLAASPRARLAQVAFVRGDYREAANWLREAITAEPSWLARARDVQALYAEPADFHAPIAALEAHLQADPTDRDGWLVLGAQLLLSDRADRAADVFLRLDDRRADPLLSALIEAGAVR